MHMTKYRNILKNYKGHQGPNTIYTLLSKIGPELQESLTGGQLGHIMTLMWESYLHGQNQIAKELL